MIFFFFFVCIQRQIFIIINLFLMCFSLLTIWDLFFSICFSIFAFFLQFFVINVKTPARECVCYFALVQ